MAGKVKYHKLSEQEKKEFLGDFYSAVASLRSRNEVKNFFKDILTLSEIVMISRRIQVAKMLFSGVTHEVIREKLKVGFNTIAQVDRWLNNGFGGYRDVLKKINQDKKNRITGEHPFSFDGLRKKYPAHFMLFNMFLDKKSKK